MERLTERNPYWINDETWERACESDAEEMDAVYHKLKEYEDLEERGLLIRLPCKVGDVLWNVENGDIESFVVEEFRITTYKINRIKIYFENTSGFGLCLFDGTLDEGWYKTLEEAEAALERMG